MCMGRLWRVLVVWLHFFNILIRHHFLIFEVHDLLQLAILVLLIARALRSHQSWHLLLDLWNRWERRRVPYHSHCVGIQTACNWLLDRRRLSLERAINHAKLVLENQIILNLPDGINCNLSRQLLRWGLLVGILVVYACCTEGLQLSIPRSHLVRESKLNRSLSLIYLLLRMLLVVAVLVLHRFKASRFATPFSSDFTSVFQTCFIFFWHWLPDIVLRILWIAANGLFVRFLIHIWRALLVYL